MNLVRLMAVLPIALAAASTVCGCEPAKAVASGMATQRGAMKIEVVRVEPRDLVHEIELPGSVRGYEEVSVHAKIGGYLESITVDIGVEVARGELIATLHVPETRADVQQAAALVKQAQAELAQSDTGIALAEARLVASRAALARSEAGLAQEKALLDLRQVECERWSELIDELPALEKRKIDEARYRLAAASAGYAGAEADHDAAQAAVAVAQAERDHALADRETRAARLEVAEAQLEQSRALLGYAEIRAPFDGLITRRRLDPGAFVRPASINSSAQPIVELARIDKVRVTIDVPMVELGWLDRGDRVVFDRIAACPGKRFEGEVARLAMALPEASRMMRAEIDLENPPDAEAGGRLLPGYYGYVTLILAEYPSLPSIPSSAVLFGPEGPHVFVVEGTRCQKRAITIAYRDETVVGVRTGLEPGEQVAVSGVNRLSDGQEVSVVRSDTTTGS
ncbi:MAG: efflux RND transporter periplasmic adaptor subunit [Planctomycetota bacterium]